MVVDDAKDYAEFLINLYNPNNTEKGEVKVMEMLKNVQFTLRGSEDFTYGELVEALELSNRAA